MSKNLETLGLAVALAFTACAAVPNDQGTTPAPQPVSQAQPVRVAKAKKVKKKKAPKRKKASFDVQHDLVVPVPAGSRNVRIWFTMPQDDPRQVIQDMKIDASYPHRIVSDDSGNKYIFVEAQDPKESELKIATSFSVTRTEIRTDARPENTRPYQPEDLADKEKWLQANEYVPIDARFVQLAARITGGDKNPVSASRKIYDWVLENIDYWVKDPKNKKASPVGSAEYCLYTGTGNCSDFHGLYASLSRAAGIPTRIVYGSLFKVVLNGVDVDASYHCWIEFFAPNLGWIPLDVAAADLYTNNYTLDADNEPLIHKTVAVGYSGADQKMVDYYFGNLDERRVMWNEGRSLKLDPPTTRPTVNEMPKAFVEIDGKPGTYDRKFTYKGK